MKVLVVSKGYIPRMKSHRFLINSPFDWHYIFHFDEDRNRIIKKLGFPHNRCHVTNVPKIIEEYTRNREWGERNLTNEGEWYCWMDDNIIEFTRLADPWYYLDRIDFDVDLDLDIKKAKEFDYDWRTMYETPCKIEPIIYELIDKCIEMKTVYGGLATETNFFFRKIKWQLFGYVRNQLSVVKNTGLPWVYWRGILMDFVRTVDVVTKYGCIVINRFVKPQKVFFEEGGIGSLEKRMPSLIQVSNELMKRYPGLLRKSKGRDYQLTFVYHSKKSIDKWRKEHGYAS